MPKRSVSVLFLGQTAKEKVTRSEKSAKDSKTQLSIKWLRLSMDLNRAKQLKYVDSELDRRAGSLKLRGIQMKPFLRRWKKAEYKKTWRIMKAKLVRRQNMRNMGLVNDSKMNQRTQKAINYFTNLEQINNPQVKQIFPEETVKEMAAKQREIVPEKEEKITPVEQSKSSSSSTKMIVSIAAVVLILVAATVVFFIYKE